MVKVSKKEFDRLLSSGLIVIDEKEADDFTIFADFVDPFESKDGEDSMEVLQ